MTTSTMEDQTEADLVVIDYNDIVTTTTAAEESSKPLLDKLDQAFGSDGNGILALRNVPGFIEAKHDVLSLAYPLSQLPADELRDLEDPGSFYNSGWSHGKEKLKADVPDLAKASFYFNPLVDIPGTAEDREKYPVSYPINKWPTKSLPKLEPACKALGCLMKKVAVQLAKHIDSYALSKNPNYQPETLYKTMVDTEKVKGRLLYYYPLQQKQQHQQEETSSAASSLSAAEDSWIGWHNDSGFLTALAGDIYMTPSGEILQCQDDDDDSTATTKDAGLYVVDRNDQVRKVSIPKDCMAIQIGECTQIITGGAVVATPHCVRGAPNLARSSLACFIDTPPSFPLSSPKKYNDDNNEFIFLSATSSSSSRVPPLKDRWKDGMTFGDFLQTTFQKYYDFNN